MQWYDRKEIFSPATITAGIGETWVKNNLKTIRNWEIDRLIRYSVALLQDDSAANFLCNSYNSEQLVIISGQMIRGLDVITISSFRKDPISKVENDLFYDTF